MRFTAIWWPSCCNQNHLAMLPPIYKVEHFEHISQMICDTFKISQPEHSYFYCETHNMSSQNLYPWNLRSFCLQCMFIVSVVVWLVSVVGSQDLDNQKQVYRVLHCQEGELTQTLSTLSDGWKMTQVRNREYNQLETVLSFEPVL